MATYTEQITAFFTNAGVPATGLSPTVEVRRLSDGVLVQTGLAMSELGEGMYVATFTADDTQKYSARCDGGVTLPTNERYTFGTSSDRGELRQVLATTDQISLTGGNVDAIVQAIDSGVEDALVASIWGEDLAPYVTAGTAGRLVQDIETATAQITFSGGYVETIVQDAGVLNDISALQVENAVWDADIPTHQLGDSAGAYMQAILDTALAIQAKTDNLPAVPASQTDVSSSTATIVAEINALAADVAVVDGVVDAIKLKTDQLTFSGSNVNALVDAIDGVVQAGIVDDIWDELVAGHTVAGSFGETNQNQVPSENIVDYRADVSALALEATAQAIKVQTDVMDFTVEGWIRAQVESIETAPFNTIVQGVWDYNVGLVAAGTALNFLYNAQSVTDAKLDAIQAKTDNLPADPASETNVDANEAKLDTLLADVAVVDGVVDAIKLKTDLLPADPTSETNAIANRNALQADLVALELTYLQPIQAKTDNLPGDPASEAQATANTNAIIAEIDGLGFPTPVQVADEVWNSLVSSYTTPGTMGAQQRAPVIGVSGTFPETVNLLAFQEPAASADYYFSDVAGAVALQVADVSNAGTIVIIRYRGGDIDVIDSGAPDISQAAPGVVQASKAIDLVNGDFLPGDVIAVVLAGLRFTVGDREISVPNPVSIATLVGESVAAQGLVTAGSTNRVINTDITADEELFTGMQIIIHRDYPATRPDYWVARNVAAYDNVTGAFTLDEDLPFIPAIGDFVVVQAMKQSALSEEIVQVMLGLVKNNVVQEMTYVNEDHVSTEVWLYSSKSDALTHDKISHIARFTMTADYGGDDLPDRITVVRDE